LPVCGYIASCYEVGKYVQPDQLAAKLIEEIGADVELRPKGVESAERWAEKLAAQVKTAIEERKLQRLFVFDDFGSVPLPPETLSFIVRLAKYADEELRPLLRVVLIQFPGQLPPMLDDVAEHDEPQPFTGLDMLSGLKQVASARGWQVSEAALQSEIQQLETQPIKLRDRFLFLRQMIRKLAQGAP
jgi:hypothetical protein